MVGVISAKEGKEVNYKFLKLLTSHGNNSLAMIVPREFIKKHQLRQGDMIIGEITGYIKVK